MKRKDLSPGLEVAYFSHSYGFDRYSNDCTNGYYWTKATVVDPGPVERSSWGELGRPKKIVDGVRITYRQRGDGKSVDAVVRPQMLVRTWADHEAQRDAQIAARAAHARQAEEDLAKRMEVLARLAPMLEGVLSDSRLSALANGERVGLTLDSLEEIVSNAKLAGFEEGRLAAVAQ